MTRAYTLTRGAGGRDHDLIEHLRETARRTRHFAVGHVRPSVAGWG